MNIHHSQNIFYKKKIYFKKVKDKQHQKKKKKKKTRLTFPGWRQKRRVLGSESIGGVNKGEGLGGKDGGRWKLQVECKINR